MAEVTKVVYVYDKGNEDLSFTDDSWQFNEAFDIEPDGEYYYEYTITYAPNVPIDFYLHIGRTKLMMLLAERGLEPI